MKAQSIIEDNIAASQHKPLSTATHSASQLDDCIRQGIVAWPTAEPLIADQARSVRFDAWRLNIQPIRHPLFQKMGLQAEFNISGKFLHVFPTLLDGAGNELLAIHTMPYQTTDPQLPATMGERGTKIGIFAMTPAASLARFTRDQHSDGGSSAPLPLTHRRARAAVLHNFARQIAALQEPYCVPVGTVIDVIAEALQDRSDLSSHPLHHRARLRATRYMAHRKLRKADKAAVLEHFSHGTAFPLGIDGYNSNSGMQALRILLNQPELPYTPREAPLSDRCLLDLTPNLLAQLMHINSAPNEPDPAIAGVVLAEPQRRNLRRFLPFIARGKAPASARAFA